MHKQKFYLLISISSWVIVFQFIIGGCAPSVLPENIYKHYSNQGASKDISVIMPEEGILVVNLGSGELYSEGMTISGPAEVVNRGDTVKDFPGLGSKNIKLLINKIFGFTVIAGLKFSQETVINIGEDGIVEVDREGIEGVDTSGNIWISKKVRYKFKSAILMIQKK